MNHFSSDFGSEKRLLKNLAWEKTVSLGENYEKSLNLAKRSTRFLTDGQNRVLLVGFCIKETSLEEYYLGKL